MSWPTSLPARLREPGSPTHAALLRIALGLHALLVLSSPSLDLLLEIGPSLHPQSHVVGGAAVFSLLTPERVSIVRELGRLAAIAVVLGAGGRWAVGLLASAFLVTQAFWFGATLFHDDWIYFVFPILALLALTQPTALSIDGLLRRRVIDAARQARESRFLVEAWVFWIGLVYAAAGIAKLFPLAKGIGWLSGRAAQEFAIEFVRQSPALALLHEPLFPYDQQWIFAVGSVLTVAVELGAVSLWLSRWTYAPLAIAIFGLHVGIWLIGIPAFVGMFAVLALALLPTRAFGRFDAAHARWLGAAPAPPRVAVGANERPPDDPTSEPTTAEPATTDTTEPARSTPNEPTP